MNKNNDNFDGIDDDILQCKLDIERARNQDSKTDEEKSSGSTGEKPRIPSFEEVISAQAKSQGMEEAKNESEDAVSGREEVLQEDQMEGDEQIAEHETAEDEPVKDEIPTFNLAEQIMSAQRNRVSASRKPPGSNAKMRDKSNQLEEVVNSIKGGDILDISTDEDLDDEVIDSETKAEDSQVQADQNDAAEEKMTDEADSIETDELKGQEENDQSLESLLNGEDQSVEMGKDETEEQAKTDISTTVPSRRVHVNLPSRLSNNQKLILENIVSRDINRIMRELKETNSVSYSKESLN